jgi:hypothetical protein
MSDVQSTDWPATQDTIPTSGTTTTATRRGSTWHTWHTRLARRGRRLPDTASTTQPCRPPTLRQCAAGLTKGRLLRATHASHARALSRTWLSEDWPCIQDSRHREASRRLATLVATWPIQRATCHGPDPAVYPIRPALQKLTVCGSWPIACACPLSPSVDY